MILANLCKVCYGRSSALFSFCKWLVAYRVWRFLLGTKQVACRDRKKCEKRKMGKSKKVKSNWHCLELCDTQDAVR